MSAEVTLALAFTTGLFGALHCFGMCGGLAGGYFAQRRLPPRLVSQLLYHGARILIYGLLGVGSAWVGQVLAQTGIVGKGQGLLMMVAGLLILVLGLRMLLSAHAGVRSPTVGAGSVVVRLEPRLRPPSRPLPALLFGAINGLVPCSLVFSIAVKAAATADPLRAGLIMLAFGIGTLPAMVAVTWLGARIGAGVRGLAVRITGGLVAILGLWTLYEGYVFFDIMRGLANW